MTKTMRNALIFLLSLALVGCENPFSSEPPMPTLVVAAGQCRGLSTSIQCTDQSRCMEDNNEIPCSSILWVVTNRTTGVRQDSGIGNPGELVQFDGVPADNYSITQTATSPDGTTDDEVHNVTVSG